MGYKAGTSAHGLVNNVKVRCSKCGATLFVNPNAAKSGGGWECPHCGKRH
jgi:DNA-directed RNA polymerase subunit RPC12/RpoP